MSVQNRVMYLSWHSQRWPQDTRCCWAKMDSSGQVVLATTQPSDKETFMSQNPDYLTNMIMCANFILWLVVWCGVKTI